MPSLQVMTAEMLATDLMYLLPSPRGNQLFEPFEKAPFDYVIFDTPPLLPAADTQILASYMQAIGLVIDPAKTPRKLLLRTNRLLDKIHPPDLIAAINKSR